MTYSTAAQAVFTALATDSSRGGIRKIAKDIKKDHELAEELWASKDYLARLVAILIMDKKQLNEQIVNQLVADMAIHEVAEQHTLMDWLFANQLTKDKKGIALINTWQNSELALQRRTFWYYQGRLRWMGKTDYENTEQLLTAIEQNIMNEVPSVQWAMNFVAGWIGVFEDAYRERCIQLGETTGLYQGIKVAKGCTPDYLPEFIRIEYNKRQTK